MRTVFAGLLTFVLTAGFVGSADAATVKKKKKATYSSGQSQSRSSERPDLSRPEDLQTGTSAWWQAMDREGRGGHNRP